MQTHNTRTYDGLHATNISVGHTCIYITHVHNGVVDTKSHMDQLLRIYHLHHAYK